MSLSPISSNAFQIACRNEFAFLTQSHGFKEVAPIAGERPDQVVFEKQGWKIAIVGMAHGTRASIDIHSPDGRLGFFSHLIERNFEKRKRPEFATGQIGDISFQACCLQTFGSGFLKGGGEWQLFEVLQQRQRQYILEAGIMSEADLKRYDDMHG